MSTLPTWITDPSLAPAWDRVRVRFEKAGLVASGSVEVPLATREQRQAVGDLLGRTITRESRKIDLAELDTRLRERSGVGGLEAVLALLGPLPENRPAARAAKVESREKPLAIASELIGATWGADWVAGLRRTGLLTNRANSESVVRDAATVLVDLTGPQAGSRTQSRVEIGARLLGDAHALDRDRVVHQVVLRGLAAAAGAAVPKGARERESLWAEFGVEPDLLSRTCLVWGLRIDDDSPLGRRLGAASDAGDPVHITEWDLRRVERFAPRVGTKVIVCENPRVLEGLAETGVAGWTAVCTSGEPNLVVDRVLIDLALSGADLRYHGDFDWPGIAIANRAIVRYGVTPWRMTVEDYVNAVRGDGLALSGPAVEPDWDSELGAAMRSHGRAVHEESVLVEMLSALAHDG